GFTQILICLLCIPELGVRQAAMLIGPGITRRRLDSFGIGGIGFRVALGGKVRVPHLQRLIAWRALSRSCRRWWCSSALALEGLECTPQSFDFLQGGLVLVLEFLKLFALRG